MKNIAMTEFDAAPAAVLSRKYSISALCILILNKVLAGKSKTRLLSQTVLTAKFHLSPPNSSLPLFLMPANV